MSGDGTARITAPWLWASALIGLLGFATLAGAQTAVDPEGPELRQDAPARQELPPLAWGALEIADARVEPGRRVRVGVATSQSFAGVEVETSFIIAHGESPGPTLCLTAGIHGDELVGIEIVRRVLVATEPNELSGTLIGVPIANPHGFQRSSRYLPDRRDLNRFFPGFVNGSAASRIAHTLFEELIARCDYIVDFHTGSFHRTNIPHLRVDMSLRDAALLAELFGSEIVLHNPGGIGTLRRAATDRGVPCVTYEAGEPLRLNEPDIEAGVEGALRLLRALGMRSDGPASSSSNQEILTGARWVRVDAGGLLRSHVKLGDRVSSGDRLGIVVDPSTNRRTDILSPGSGRVVGMALDQAVIPGFAAYHLGITGRDVSAEPVTDATKPPQLDTESDPEELPE